MKERFGGLFRLISRDKPVPQDFKSEDELIAFYQQWIRYTRKRVLGKDFEKEWSGKGGIARQLHVDSAVQQLPEVIGGLIRKTMPGSEHVRMFLGENPTRLSGEEIVISPAGEKAGKQGWGVDPVRKEQIYVVFNFSDTTVPWGDFEDLKPQTLQDRCTVIYPNRTWDAEDFARALTGDKLSRQKIGLLNEFSQPTQHPQDVTLAHFTSLVHYIHGQRNHLQGDISVQGAQTMAIVGLLREINKPK